MALADQKCIPCEGGVPPLTREQIEPLLAQVADWNIVDYHHIEKEYTFKDFKDALAFVNKVGELAEEQGHHPDVYLAWGKVKLTLWTHKIDGLTESDFVFAAKVDAL